jgi:quercetin dioxygenase-like cupin family protein
MTQRQKAAVVPDDSVILEGELTLILDDEDVKLNAFVIQGGTNHGWRNNSEKNAHTVRAARRRIR